MKGAPVPQGWQGGLPFHYHYGPSGVKVHLVSVQDYQVRTIWDVIGKIKGSEHPEDSVIVGNHRDAWVYGAVDPSSGTAAMLEAVHGIGALLKQGWRPRRTLIFASWDAEEEGLIGSTEWVEQQAGALDHAVAYFNTDVAVDGTSFTANAVPSLQQFLRQVTRAVPSPLGGTVYQQWMISTAGEIKSAGASKHPNSGDLSINEEVHVGDIGSGSDFTPFLQHAGVPSTDIGAEGTYGVYHSVFDNYAWYVQNADPHFVYLQQMARVLGLEALRMADCDVLPLDYVVYARAIGGYLDAAKKKAAETEVNSLDFTSAQAAAARFAAAAQKAHALQLAPTGNMTNLNHLLRQTETALLTDAGLPNRPWYRHTIYAPGEYTGYSAVVIPGVNEAVDAKDAPLAQQQITVLAQALNRAAQTLEQAR
jgi:N-acetylated-alpha-linked acidic dipeptidase